MKIGGVRLLGDPVRARVRRRPGNPPKIAPDEALYFLVQAVKLG